MECAKCSTWPIRRKLIKPFQLSLKVSLIGWQGLMKPGRGTEFCRFGNQSSRLSGMAPSRRWLECGVA
jgi:hypothetical protein